MEFDYKIEKAMKKFINILSMKDALWYVINKDKIQSVIEWLDKVEKCTFSDFRISWKELSLAIMYLESHK